MLKNILKSIDEAVIIDAVKKDQIEGLVVQTLNFVEQTHLYHLMTKSYSEHMAIGEFYDGISENADSLAESYIGINGGLSLKPIQVEFKVNYNKPTFIAELDAFRQVVTDGIEATNESSLMSLNGILVTLQGQVDELSYKLGFK